MRRRVEQDAAAFRIHKPPYCYQRIEMPATLTLPPLGLGNPSARATVLVADWTVDADNRAPFFSASAIELTFLVNAPMPRATSFAVVQLIFRYITSAILR